MSDTTVTMIKSVNEYEAGAEYTLSADLADTFIVKGYAEGTPSRVFSESEITALTSNDQKVGT